MNIDEDDTKLFRLLEPGEFGIYTQSDELPVSDCPVYLMEGVGGICLSGTATVQVFSHRFRIVRGMVLALFPWQLISIKEVSDDFGIRFFRISHDMFPCGGPGPVSFFTCARISPRSRGKSMSGGS